MAIHLTTHPVHSASLAVIPTAGNPDRLQNLVNTIRNSSLFVQFSTVLKNEPAAGLMTAAFIFLLGSAVKDLITKTVTQTTGLKFGGALSTLYTLYKIAKFTSRIKQLSQCIQENKYDLTSSDHHKENLASDILLNLLIQSHKPSGRDARDIVFVALPTWDPEQAFSLKGMTLFNNFSRLCKAFQVKWIRANNGIEITNAMKRCKTIISHLWILAHGTENSEIRLGPAPNDLLTKEEINQDTFPNLSPTAHALISCCYSGKYNGIGARITLHYPKITVFALHSIASIGLLYLDRNAPVIFHTDQDGENVTVQLSHK